MKISEVFKNALLLALVSFGVFLGSDPLIRRLCPIPKKGYGVWAAYPGSEVQLVITPDHFSGLHRYNNFGFRGADFPLEPKSEIRIVCVGDSYTEGIGVQEDEAWPSVLSHLFDGEEWEVINLGDGGSQLDRYARIIAQVAIPLRPTDIVVCVLPGDLRYGPDVPPDLEVRTDFDDPFRDNRRSWLKPVAKMLPGWLYLFDRARGRWPVQKGLMWSVYDEQSITKSVVRELSMRRNISPLKARRLVALRKGMIAEKVIESSKKGEFNSALIRLELLEPYILYRHTISDMHVDEEDLRECTYYWIEWYSQVCNKFGIRPWLLYFPVAPLVCEGNWGPFEDKYYEQAPRILNDNSIAMLISETCKKYNVRFIDASIVLCTHKAEKLYHRWDTHPASRAYELVALVVAEAMKPVLTEAHQGPKKSTTTGN